MRSMTIGELAHQAGVHAQTIRLYERQGLLPEPRRRASGDRQYPLETAGRLRFIRAAKGRAGALMFAVLLFTPAAAAEKPTEALVAPPATHSAAEEDAQGIEHTLILGVGGAAELEPRDGSFHPGANLMLEWDAIEDWLELEIGASVLSTDGGVEVPIDLLVKKPFRLARWSELMIGVGPEVVHVTGGADRGTYFGGALALDFMFWPWGQRVGLWVEPEYDLVFHDGASSGIGTTGGVLLGW